MGKFKLFAGIWFFCVLSFFINLVVISPLFGVWPDWLIFVFIGVILVGIVTYVLTFFFSFRTGNGSHIVLTALAPGLVFGIFIALIFLLPQRTQQFENYSLQKAKEATPQDSSVEEVVEGVHGYLSAPIIQSNEISYFVNGSTREELCKSVEKWQEKEDQGDRLAYINYNILYNYYTVWTTKGYTIGNFTVTAKSTITVPQWSSSGGASDSTKEAWRNFKNKVSAHERQHRDILMDYATRLITAYNNLGYYPAENSTKTALDSIFNDIYSQMTKAQKDFDKKYGRSESYADLCYN